MRSIRHFPAFITSPGAWRWVAPLALVTLSVSQPCHAQFCGIPVPAAYQDLCNQVYTDLNAFNATIAGLGGGAPYPVLYTGELSDANANNGPQIVNPGY